MLSKIRGTVRWASSLGPVWPLLSSALSNASVFRSEQYRTAKTKGLHPGIWHSENCLIWQTGTSRLNLSWIFPFSDFRGKAPLWPLTVFVCQFSSSPAVMMFDADRSAVGLSVCNSPGNRFSVCFFKSVYLCPLSKGSPCTAQRSLGYCGPEITSAFSLSQARSAVVATILFLFWLN